MYNTGITVIIPARNEEANIKNCIDSILKQQFPAHLLEIIIIDDFSTDTTGDIVLSYKLDNVKLIRLAEKLSGTKINSYKKRAITEGINAAKGSLIITTDADCLFPDKWLPTMVAFYEKYKPAFIAAPVAFINETSALNIFQSIDFLTMQGITGAAVHTHFQCMCNGANLAYERAIFHEVNGFEGIDNIASGDDMLLMHKIFSKYPKRVMYLKSAEAIASTAPVNTIKEFFNQRIRWASKADKFNDKKITVVLLLVYLFNVSLIADTIYAFFQFEYVKYCALIWILKTLVELIFIFPVAGFFNKKKLLWWFIPLQPFHVLYIIISGWLGKFGNYTWKGRQVK